MHEDVRTAELGGELAERRRDGRGSVVQTPRGADGGEPSFPWK